MDDSGIVGAMDDEESAEKANRGFVAPTELVESIESLGELFFDLLGWLGKSFLKFLNLLASFVEMLFDW